MKHLYGRYAAMYHFTYMSIGALTPMIGQYLKQIGFSGTQIGTVTATGTAVAIFASTFWGGQYSRSLKKHEILLLLCGTAALISLILSGIHTYGVFLLVFGALYFFQAPVMSLCDAFTVESGQGFGGLRAWGAIGFALGTFLTGLCVESLGLSVLFWIYSGSYLLAVVMILWIRKGEGDMQRRGRNEAGSLRGYLEVFKVKPLRRLILCAFFWGGTNVANNTYFSFLYMDGGGSLAGVGTVMLLMVGSEFPFMAWCERISRKLTMEKLTALSLGISVVRFLIFSLGVPWWMLVVLSFSQGAVNGILLIELVRYAAKLAPEGIRSLAISAYYIIGSNLSTICCQFFGGILLDHFGAEGVYLFFGLFNLTGLILYFLFGLYRPQRVEKSGQKRG